MNLNIQCCKAYRYRTGTTWEICASTSTWGAPFARRGLSCTKTSPLVRPVGNFINYSDTFAQDGCQYSGSVRILSNCQLDSGGDDAISV